MRRLELEICHTILIILIDTQDQYKHPWHNRVTMVTFKTNVLEILLNNNYNQIT